MITPVNVDQVAEHLAEARAARDDLLEASRALVAAETRWRVARGRWAPLCARTPRQGDVSMLDLPSERDLPGEAARAWLRQVEQQAARAVPAPWPLLTDREITWPEQPTGQVAGIGNLNTIPPDTVRARLRAVAEHIADQAGQE